VKSTASIVALGLALCCACTPTFPAGDDAVHSRIWEPRNGEIDVCAWRGGTFTPQDFLETEPYADAGWHSCINYARCAWEVSLSRGQASIAIQDRRATPSDLPFRIERGKPEEGLSGARLSPEVCGVQPQDRLLRPV
jgi:hypothetical protein